MRDKGLEDAKKTLEQKHDKRLDDGFYVRNLVDYLIRKLNNTGYLKIAGSHMDVIKASSELYEIDKYADDAVVLEQVNQWIDKYLTEQQKENMHAAMRQRKRRARGVGRSITISHEAHKMLVALAEWENITLLYNSA